MLAEAVYLGSYLEPLAPFLARPDVTDIYVNRPCEVWIEALGDIPRRMDVPELTAKVLRRLARQVAASNAQGISREHPLLSGSLPDGSRIQIVLPPATRGDIAIAIRRHVSAGLSLREYDDAGMFADVAVTAAPRRAHPGIEPASVMKRLSAAVRERRNILISGGTSTGKTTFLNALLKEVPLSERLILIEDAAELQLLHDNAVGLLSARGSQGEADVSTDDLLIASLRMRPDRIILGEMRGSEALTFLRAVNTGHPGSMSTIHADSPRRAIDQLALLVLQSGMTMSWDNVVNYARRSIDLVVQLKRIDGRRVVHEIATLEDVQA